MIPLTEGNPVGLELWADKKQHPGLSWGVAFIFGKLEFKLTLIMGFYGHQRDTNDGSWRTLAILQLQPPNTVGLQDLLRVPAK